MGLGDFPGGIPWGNAFECRVSGTTGAYIYALSGDFAIAITHCKHT